jgi:hypothetical protein
MTRYLAVLAAAMLAACSGGKDTGPTGDTGGTPGDDDDACENSVVTRFPVSGDADVFYKTDVRFSLEAEEADASITVTDGAGAVVDGQTTVAGTLVTWDGTADLAPSTAYTATLSYSCGEDAISFTTSNTGEPTGGGLEGRVYALDLAGGDWVEPPGVGPLLSSQLGDTQVLVSPLALDATSITMIGAIGSAGIQDLCSPTLPFPPADWTDPYFSLAAPALDLVVAGFTVTIQDLDLSGAFAPDASRIQGAALKGTIDTRPLGVAFDLGTAPDAVCQLVATFGVACQECGDGEPYCLSVYIDAVEAGYLNGSTIVERTDADIAADPACTP